MNRKPSYIVIFGITGNLSRLKILPALYDLFINGVLSPDTHIIGVGRKPLTSAQFSVYLVRILTEYTVKEGITLNPAILQQMLEHTEYLKGNITKRSLYSTLSKRLEKHSAEFNYIYYLATYPVLYKHILSFLVDYKLHKNENGYVRIMVEKPIGNDETSATFLNNIMNQYFSENQIYRLDHYLGKESLQNIITFRFKNRMIEPLFTNEYIDHIQITVAEAYGVDDRGGYYDQTGALRDVGQNHLLQMLTLITMEQPKYFSPNEIRRERIKVLQALEPLPKSIVLGQYDGYLNEPSVLPHSRRETFFAIKTYLHNSRFEGVPIYMRSGKKMKENLMEIIVAFKQDADSEVINATMSLPNYLYFRIQPNEGIGMRFLVKKPGTKTAVQPARLQFKYKDLVNRLPNPYERLIADALEGDQTFFTDAKEVEAQWRFIDPLVNTNLTPKIYTPGSWGPKAADKLLSRDSRVWLSEDTLAG